MFLCHYFDKRREPFLSLSDLSDEEALKIHKALESNLFCKRNRDSLYMYYRRIVENKLYSGFIAKGGKPQRRTPFYMVLGEYDNFYKPLFEYNELIKIPLEEFSKDIISFTYGDSFPTFDPTHGETQEYRQNVYTYDEIIKKYK